MPELSKEGQTNTTAALARSLGRSGAPAQNDRIIPLGGYYHQGHKRGRFVVAGDPDAIRAADTKTPLIITVAAPDPEQALGQQESTIVEHRQEEQADSSGTDLTFGEQDLHLTPLASEAYTTQTTDTPKNVENTIKREDYTLAVEDFLEPPSTTERYHHGDRITRANFVSFINTSFAVSQGFPLAQQYYFQWLDDHEKFDTATAVRNFLSAGGAEMLNDEEKATIVSGFRQVKKHSKMLEAKKADSSDEAIIAYFEEQVKEIVDPTPRFEDNPFRVPLDELKTMSLGELQARIKIHAKANTQYK